MADYIIVKSVSKFEHTYTVHKDDIRKLAQDNSLSDEQLAEKAKEYIAKGDIEESSQTWVGEYINETTQEMSEEEMIDLFDKENPYLEEWLYEDKVKWVRKLPFIRLDNRTEF